MPWTMTTSMRVAADVAGFAVAAQPPVQGVLGVADVGDRSRVTDGVIASRGSQLSIGLAASHA
jgi:hypothetical protein